MNIKAKRCSVCKKLIGSGNKSGLCNYHLVQKSQKEKRAKKKLNCCICREPCKGNLQMEIRKGRLYSFCTYHFNKYQFTSLKELREIIRNAKKGC